MRQKGKHFLFYAILLLVLLSLPGAFTSKLRIAAVSLLAPFFKELVDVKIWLSSSGQKIRNEGDPVQTEQQEIERLLLENHLLGHEVSRLKELVEQEFFLFHGMLPTQAVKHVGKAVVQQHEKEILNLFHLQLLHVPARVIFRPLNAWNNTFWIDKGQVDNRALGRVVIAKNSPVVLGLSVVGVVDQVGEKQSLVRLITDPKLHPSVRVKRGNMYLAKGELIGYAEQKFRGGAALLRGVNFNYDFADCYGPARDLRTGKPLTKEEPVNTTPLVQCNDLLVTTGMDGVFPPGLHTAIVHKIFPLKEGDFSFEIEAESTAGNLSDLVLVFVLPPISTLDEKTIP